MPWQFIYIWILYWFAVAVLRVHSNLALQFLAFEAKGIIARALLIEAAIAASPDLHGDGFRELC